ncbi:hypothetical protein [Leptospira interrogans]|uniref:hypothetical protein n=1 Tax=Leptospira interrogans TaxID=173 RepID=UPI00193AE8CE|nr:hypothetical protein [Leptospira interrogans]MBM2890306.1 hypothetical protein [Leptospira interrogans]
MFDQLVKSTQEFLKERISSPLLISFAIAWCASNWDLLYVLLFEDKTIGLIDRIIYARINHGSINFNIFEPFLFSISFTVIYPFVSLLIVALWSWVDNRKKKIINQIYNKRELTLEESLVLRENIERLKEDYGKSLTKKDREIQDYKDEVNRLKESLNNSESSYVNNTDEIRLRFEITDLAKRLLKKFPNNKKEIDTIFNMVSGADTLSGLSSVEAEILTFLTVNGIVELLDHTKLIYKYSELGKKVVSVIVDDEIDLT